MSWLTLVLLAAVAAIAPWPSWAAVRLRRLGGRPRWPAMSALSGLEPRWFVGALGLLGGGGGAWSPVLVAHGTLAVLPGLAGALAGGAGGLVVAAEVSRRRQDAELRATAEAFVGLGDELRAGQRPVAALAAAAGATAHSRVSGVLADAAAAGRSGGHVPAVLRGGTPARFGLLAAAWVVSERSGASLADLVGRLEAEVQAEQTQRQQALAHLAGSRATMAMLAVLPAAGLFLAGGLGADPAGVLLATVPGQLALVGGVLLDAIGVLWSLRILRSASTS